MNIIEAEKALTEAEIADVEKRYDFAFPSEYRAFLLQYNGGRPEPCAFRFASENYGDSEVDRFLAINEGRLENFEDYYKGYKGEQKRLPEALIPIANDPGGNLICIAVSGEKCGAVFFWDHEMEGEDAEEADNLFLIAASFNAFLDSLYALPPDDNETETIPAQAQNHILQASRNRDSQQCTQGSLFD